MLMDRTSYIVSGALSAIAGAVFLFFPVMSGGFFAILIGVVFLVAGVSSIISYASTLRGMPGAGGFLAMGILGLILGIICLVHPVLFAATLGWLIAVCVIAGGICQLAAGISVSGMSGRGWMIVSAIAMIIFGACACIWPEMIMQFIGIGLLIEGITMIILGIRATPIEVDVLPE